MKCDTNLHAFTKTVMMHESDLFKFVAGEESKISDDYPIIKVFALFLQMIGF